MMMLEGHPQSDLTALAEHVSQDQLTLTAFAVARVLTALLQREVPAEQARAWASFVRRGYVSTKETPVRAISILYQADREDQIVEALSRMDELGDLVDGKMSDDELRYLIATLSD